MELILDISVRITGSREVCGSSGSAAMVEFTGSAGGRYFTGNTVGSGVDTQMTDKNGICRLSARYMLEGTDFAGDKCRIFIENNSNESGSFTPMLITDSRALSHWESAPLSAEILPAEGGVNVRIYLE